MFKVLGAKNRPKNLHKHPDPPFQIRGGPGSFSNAKCFVTDQKLNCIYCTSKNRRKSHQKLMSFWSETLLKTEEKVIESLCLFDVFLDWIFKMRGLMYSFFKPANWNIWNPSSGTIQLDRKTNLDRDHCCWYLHWSNSTLVHVLCAFLQLVPWQNEVQKVQKAEQEAGSWKSPTSPRSLSAPLLRSSCQPTQTWKWPILNIAATIWTDSLLQWCYWRFPSNHAIRYIP